MTAGKQFRKDIRELQSDLGTLMKHLETASGDKISQIGESVVDTKALAAEKLKNLMEDMDDAVGRLGDGIKRAEKKAETTIQDHPIASVLAAVGLGLLVGKFIELSRR